jgi:hypothetical protein
MSDIVECHSDYTYAERPVAIIWEGKRLEIKEIMREWRRPLGKGFRVCTVDGQEFDLLFEDSSSEWKINQP